MTEEISQPKRRIIFQLGTNNWQVNNEAAPGSGILHASYHNAFNQIENTVCYSVYPSKVQKNADLKQTKNVLTKVKIYELTEDIPVCESASPVSSRRWHSMSDKEVNDYVTNLENLCYDYFIEIEKYEKESLTLVIAHHCFMNCVILKNILEKRKKSQLSLPPIAFYGHGTGLKMYQNELNESLKEYPIKFYPMMNNLEIFGTKYYEKGHINFGYANSSKTIKAFAKIFPNFPIERVILSPCGINPNIFNYNPKLTLNEVLEEKEDKLQYVPYIGSDKKPYDIPRKGYKWLVLFVGKMAHWKRLNCLLIAATIYEKELGESNVITLVIGGGPNEKYKKYQIQNEKLGNKSVYFCGPKMQTKLAKLYNVASIGVFPSKNEPFGMVLLECMACGTPVIGANSGGPATFVSKECGYLLKETDDSNAMATELAAQIINALRNNWKASKMNACLKKAEDYNVLGQCRRMLEDTDLFIADNNNWLPPKK